MNEKSELKILREILTIIEQPAQTARKFTRYARLAMLTCMLLIFFCLSDNIDITTHPYIVLVCTFLAGTAAGLAIWFLQAGMQTAILVRHMSSESIQGRIDELSSA